MATSVKTQLEKVVDQQAYKLFLEINPERGNTLLPEGPAQGELKESDPSIREIKFKLAPGDGSRVAQEILLDTYDIGTETTVQIALLDDRGNPMDYDMQVGGGLEHYDDADGGGED